MATDWLLSTHRTSFDRIQSIANYDPMDRHYIWARWRDNVPGTNGVSTSGDIGLWIISLVSSVFLYCANRINGYFTMKLQSFNWECGWLNNALILVGVGGDININYLQEVSLIGLACLI